MFQPRTFQESILKNVYTFISFHHLQRTNRLLHIIACLLSGLYVFSSTCRNQASLGIVADADSRAGFIDFDSVPKVPFSFSPNKQQNSFVVSNPTRWAYKTRVKLLRITPGRPIYKPIYKAILGVISLHS